MIGRYVKNRINAAENNKTIGMLPSKTGFCGLF